MTFKSESSAAPFKFSVCQKWVALAEPWRFQQPQNVAIKIHLLSANAPQGGNEKDLIERKKKPIWSFWSSFLKQQSSSYQKNNSL